MEEQKKQKPTAVNLTLKAQKIKDKYVPGSSLKGVLSVSLELFEALLSPEEKHLRVQDAMIEDKAARLAARAQARAKGKRGKSHPPDEESQ